MTELERERPSFKEFDRLTHDIITPALKKFGFSEQQSIEKPTYFHRDYVKAGRKIHVMCERLNFYTDIRLGYENAPGIFGQNILNLASELGRPVDAYEADRLAPLIEKYSLLARLLEEQLCDVLTQP